MIRGLYLQNYRRFLGHHEIGLGQITVVFGRNGIGKTSLLEAIGVLGQTLGPARRVAAHSGRFVLTGPYVGKSGTGEIRCRHAVDQAVGLGLQLTGAGIPTGRGICMNLLHGQTSTDPGDRIDLKVPGLISLTHGQVLMDPFLGYAILDSVEQALGAVLPSGHDDDAITSLFAEMCSDETIRSPSGGFSDPVQRKYIQALLKPRDLEPTADELGRPARNRFPALTRYVQLLDSSEDPHSHALCMMPKELRQQFAVRLEHDTVGRLSAFVDELVRTCWSWYAERGLRPGRTTTISAACGAGPSNIGSGGFALGHRMRGPSTA